MMQDSANQNINKKDKKAEGPTCQPDLVLMQPEVVVARTWFTSSRFKISAGKDMLGDVLVQFFGPAQAAKASELQQVRHPLCAGLLHTLAC